MSIKVTTWVWENGPETPVERFVLLALADFADDQGRCWPSVATIARRCCMSDRNARRILRRLEVGGWLTCAVRHGRNRTSRYRIHLPETAHSVGTQRSPGHPQPENRTTRARKPDITLSAEPSGTVKDPFDETAVGILGRVMARHLAEELIAHRKVLKRPLTPQGARIIADRFRGRDDADRCVRKAIANGWCDVRPASQAPTVKSVGSADSGARDRNLEYFRRVSGK